MTVNTLHVWLARTQVGEALAAEGWDGLLATSAARPAHLIICLFRASDDSISGARLLPPRAHVEAPPAPPTGMTT